MDSASQALYPLPVMPLTQTVAPLRQAILIRVSLLTTATVLLVATGVVVFGLLPMIDRIAQSQFNVAATRVEASLDAMFAPAGSLLEMTRGWLAGAAPVA